MRKPKSPRQKKLKTVAYRYIPPETEIGIPLYALLRELVHAHHREIAAAKIALAWNLTWQPDADGRVILGQCRKVSDLEREVFELSGFDFVIILRREFWNDLCVTQDQRRALLDHELCHATVAMDDHGEPLEDERGRIVYRLRKHDLEEFSEIADRYGCWKRDIEQFARSLDRARHKAKGKWIGYERLQEELRIAGVHVSLDSIVTWSDVERREASVWADVHRPERNKTPALPKLDLMPSFLAAAAVVQVLDEARALLKSPADILPDAPPAPGEAAPGRESVQ